MRFFNTFSKFFYIIKIFILLKIITDESTLTIIATLDYMVSKEALVIAIPE